MTETNSSQANHWSEETSLTFVNYGRYFVPKREYQMQVVSELLLTLNGQNHLVDLCCGEGLLDELILESYPTFTLHGFDGSIEMLRRAQERLSRFGDRFTCSRFELASSDWRNPQRTVNAVLSSLAIHHLRGTQKQELFTDVFRMLAPNGIFIVADIVAHPDKMGEHQSAEALDDIVRRRSIELDGHTAAFEFFSKEGWNMFRYLDPDDIDKPSPLFDQLKWLEQSGFFNVDVHWMLAGHAIFSARKPAIA